MDDRHAARNLIEVNRILDTVEERLAAIKGYPDAYLIEMVVRLLGRNLTVRPPPYVLEDMVLAILKWCESRNLPEVL